MTTAELASWSATKKVLLLDVRARAEFEVSHLPAAVWAETEAQQHEAIARSEAEAVVLYCSVGWRSAIAVEGLVRSGGQRVYNLTGSIFQWANEGRPLTDGRTEVKTVHPFNRTWGPLLQRRLWPSSWLTHD
ncbi:MAG: rhodanese-like domain-containing protein [Deltaproteobacteria bacterium]|nr:rhodanese-like domain-containing protein [Deltaproteobacteria bacterium]